MPKGVEHTGAASSPAPEESVPTSVMPKGVEHAYEAATETARKGADLCDAERR